MSTDLVWVGIHEVIEINGSLGVVHPPGVAVVLDDFTSDDPNRYIGKTVQLRSVDGRTRALTVGATRNHGVTISLFFANLVKSDVPPGSIVGIAP